MLRDPVLGTRKWVVFPIIGDLTIFQKTKGSVIAGASQQCSALSWQIPLSTSTGGFGIFPLHIPIGRAGSHSLSKLLGSAGGFGVGKKKKQ